MFLSAAHPKGDIAIALDATRKGLEAAAGAQP
jgi:hypothetical protein